jgi:hypothetical protein
LGHKCSPAFLESLKAVPVLAEIVAVIEAIKRDPQTIANGVNNAEDRYRDIKSAKRHITVPRDQAFGIIIRASNKLSRPLNRPQQREFIRDVVELARPIAPTFKSKISPERLRAFAPKIG